MLTESFVVSTLNPEKPCYSTSTGIHFYEHKPIAALKSTFKKSSTASNCLAVHPTHAFASQADKAVIHVYNRERNNQEAIVPFPERIHSIALAGELDGAGILVLGTEGGRLILWELATGRQVSTPQHHLQRITCLAVDPTTNFLLSGSLDSRVHVWSIPELLSFSTPVVDDIGQDLPLSPLRSLSNHRQAITAIVLGHSWSRNNIAVTASRDNTCIVWEYSSGDLLHTFLLSASPLCLTLDPADRAVYAGYEDGSVQYIDFYSRGRLPQQLRNPFAESTPTQPGKADTWPPTEEARSAILCLQVSYDGTSLLSGHENGHIHTWDVALGDCGKYLADFAAPITNLHMLRPSGFPKSKQPAVKLHNVIKPRYDSFTNGKHSIVGGIPPAYTFTAQFTSNLPSSDLSRSNAFHDSLVHPSFPLSDLEDALSEFNNWHDQTHTAPESTDLAQIRAQNATLTSQLKAAEARIQDGVRQERKRVKDQEVKAVRKKKRRLRLTKLAEADRKKEMGEKISDGDEEMEEDHKDETELSSSTDEFTDNF